MIAVRAVLLDNPILVPGQPFSYVSQPVFFAHANGFPSATYGKLFRALGADYAVDFLEQHGHDPRFPG